MKRWWRWCLRGAIGLAVLAAVGLVAALDGVDWRPYFTQPYYVETQVRLRGAVEAIRREEGMLYAGLGRARLTPELNAATEDSPNGRFRQLPLAGYGARQGRPATGVRDELEVKAVALRVGGVTVVLASMEALIVPAEVTDLVMERLGREAGLTRTQVYLSATHTHCSLGGWGEGPVGELFAGPFAPGARIWMAECIVRAVRGALGSMAPAELGRGSFAAPDCVRNRLVGDRGKVDPEFSYLLIRREDGRQAVLGSFAAHATVLSAEVMEFAGDYPGAWQRAVEEAGGGMAVFLAGGMGSHGPVAGGKGFAGAESLGRTLAVRTLASLAGIATTRRVALGAVGVELVLPPLNVRLTDGVRLRPWLARRLLPAREVCTLQAVRLNDALWLSTPCDYSGELALDLKDFLKARGFAGVVTSFNGGYVGYVLPPRYAHLAGYEPRTMGFYGPNVPVYFDEVLRSLAAGLWATGP